MSLSAQLCLGGDAGGRPPGAHAADPEHLNGQQQHLEEWLYRLEAKMDQVVELCRQPRPPLRALEFRLNSKGSLSTAAQREVRNALQSSSRRTADITGHDGAPVRRSSSSEKEVASLQRVSYGSTGTDDEGPTHRHRQTTGSNGTDDEGDELPVGRARTEKTQRSMGLRRALDEKLQDKLTKTITSSTDKLGKSVWHGALNRLVLSPQFDVFIMLLIFGNAILIGAQVQHSAVSDTSVKWFTHAEYACTLLFTLELIARIVSQGGAFWTNTSERAWNMFDAFLVSISLIDFLLVEAVQHDLPSSSSSVSKLVRAIRIMRILRMIRTVRFLTQLRILMKMIVSSLQSLFWILIILVGINYGFAVMLTQGATDYLSSSSEEPADSGEVRLFFGSLFDTMYTLFKCVSGGLNWGNVSAVMHGLGWPMESLLVLYIFFVVFAVANIVNGVFVDGAIELAKRDRLVIISKQKADDEAKTAHLVNLLASIDLDGNQMISFEEFCHALEMDDVREFISAMQIEISDAKAFFALLDENEGGQVSIVEFVSGMLKLRGEARSLDVHMMMHENKKIKHMVSGIVDMLQGDIYDIADTLGGANGARGADT